MEGTESRPGQEPARPGTGPGSQWLAVFRRACGRLCGQCRRVVVTVLSIATESLCITMHKDSAHLRERDVDNHPPLWIECKCICNPTGPLRRGALAGR